MLVCVLMFSNSRLLENFWYVDRDNQTETKKKKTDDAELLRRFN